MWNKPLGLRCTFPISRTHGMGRLVASVWCAHVRALDAEVPVGLIGTLGRIELDVRVQYFSDLYAEILNFRFGSFSPYSPVLPLDDRIRAVSGHSA
jgi:hypothetical protein